MKGRQADEPIIVREGELVRDGEHAAAHETRRRLQQLAWLLDSSIPIPGTRLTIGLEALIGLIPLLGDLIGVALSSFILVEAHKLGVSRTVFLRMSFNVALEGIVGIIPFAGDVFDAAFKANQRNVKLLDDWMDRPDRAKRGSRAFLLWLLIGLAAVLGLCGFAAFVLIRWLFGL
ncbi:MAG: DUF4112 domain-containing protein [Pseudomonadota bacterium]